MHNPGRGGGKYGPLKQRSAWLRKNEPNPNSFTYRAQALNTNHQKKNEKSVASS